MNVVVPYKGLIVGAAEMLSDVPSQEFEVDDVAPSSALSFLRKSRMS